MNTPKPDYITPGAKVVMAIGASNRISDAGKLKALDAITDMVKTDCIDNNFHVKEAGTYNGLEVYDQSMPAGYILVGMFWFDESELGKHFWWRIYDYLTKDYQFNSNPHAG
jgi:hypothetical protein